MEHQTHRIQRSKYLKKVTILIIILLLVEKIENSFKNFKKKQKIFLDNLKVLWNRIYFENGQEFRDYIDRHTIREKEKLTANNPKTKFDYFLKKIIRGLIFKN